MSAVGSGRRTSQPPDASRLLEDQDGRANPESDRDSARLVQSFPANGLAARRARERRACRPSSARSFRSRTFAQTADARLRRVSHRQLAVQVRAARRSSTIFARTAKSCGSLVKVDPLDAGRNALPQLRHVQRRAPARCATTAASPSASSTSMTSRSVRSAA